MMLHEYYLVLIDIKGSTLIIISKIAHSVNNLIIFMTKIEHSVHNFIIIMTKKAGRLFLVLLIFCYHLWVWI